MSDPITVGALVAGALGMVAEALLKGSVGEAAKDAYKGLKEKVSHWASADVAELEKAPKSIPRKAVIAEIIDSQSPEDQESLRVLAGQLLEKLKANPQAVGLDIGRLTALEVQLGDLTVTSGVGARIEEANVGTLTTGKISVGSSGK